MSSDESKLQTILDELYSSIDNSVSVVQQHFDIYQANAFIERSPEFFCLELCGEAGELANLQKKVWKGKDIPQERLNEETADVFIALMNYANAQKIDIASAVTKKLNAIEKKRRSLANNGEIY